MKRKPEVLTGESYCTCRSCRHLSANEGTSYVNE